MKPHRALKNNLHKRVYMDTGNLHEWFKQEISIRNTNGERIKTVKVIRRITELFVKNGMDLNFNGWGVHDVGDDRNPYGNYGLNQDEAIELNSYKNVIWGYALALGVEDDENWYEENVFSHIKDVHKKDIEDYERNKKDLESGKDTTIKWEVGDEFGENKRRSDDPPRADDITDVK